MTIGRWAVVALVAVLSLGGIGTAFAQFGGGDIAAEVDPIELRKDDSRAEIGQEDEADGDGDDTAGDDGTAGGANPGDGDRTRGDDGTDGGNNTGDGDATRGDDGSSGGDNTFAAPAPARPAMASGEWSDDGGGSWSGGGEDT